MKRLHLLSKLLFLSLIVQSVNLLALDPKVWGELLGKFSLARKSYVADNMNNKDLVETIDAIMGNYGQESSVPNKVKMIKDLNKEFKEIASHLNENDLKKLEPVFKNVIMNLRKEVIETSNKKVAEKQFNVAQTLGELPKKSDNDIVPVIKPLVPTPVVTTPVKPIVATQIATTTGKKFKDWKEAIDFLADLKNTNEKDRLSAAKIADEELKKDRKAVNAYANPRIWTSGKFPGASNFEQVAQKGAAKVEKSLPQALGKKDSKSSSSLLAKLGIGAAFITVTGIIVVKSLLGSK